MRLSPAVLVTCIGFLVPTSLSAQQSVAVPAPTPPQRDAQAVALANRALGALAGNVAVTDATVSGTATRIAGSDTETGTFVAMAKGFLESSLSLSLSGGQSLQTRAYADGAPEGARKGADGTVQETALHNCWTDASWFFPALSSLASLRNSAVGVTYVGRETWQGAPADHLRFWQEVVSPDAPTVKLIAHLSTIDLYLDPGTGLPLAEDFTAHPEGNASLDIAVEIRYSDYEVVSGVHIPMHVQKLLQNSLALDLQITSVTLNSGLPESEFQLQSTATGGAQ